MENKTIVFGDIHGCYKAADAAVQLAKIENAKAVFLGDYIDRGPDSIKTLEILIEAKRDNPDWIFLRGNHDQMLLDLIMGAQEMNSEFDVIAGRTSNTEATKVFLKWKELPELRKNEIIQFLESTIFYHETENWIFVHAPLKDTNTPLAKKPKEELIWNYELNPIWEGKQFMHGHAIVDRPTNTNNGTNINTGCGFGDRLTGMLIKVTLLTATLRKHELIHFSISESGIIEQQT
jgi:serine/threonine protein phosphatase 1